MSANAPTMAPKPRRDETLLTPAPPVELSTGAVVLSAGVGPLEVAEAASVEEDGAAVAVPVPVVEPSLLVCGETSLVEAEAEVSGTGVVAVVGTEGDSGAGTVMLEVAATVLSTEIVVVRPDEP